jgi:hypothetical protein
VKLILLDGNIPQVCLAAESSIEGYRSSEIYRHGSGMSSQQSMEARWVVHGKNWNFNWMFSIRHIVPALKCIFWQIIIFNRIVKLVKDFCPIPQYHLFLRYFKLTEFSIVLYLQLVGQNLDAFYGLCGSPGTTL